MNRGAMTRLRRIERQDGDVEFWLDCGDGFVRNGQTGAAMPAEPHRAEHPGAFRFTFQIGAVDSDTAP